ncbi:hypothetical protein AMAG_14895 [Allomyces macrogynus ATCC 38327]|uniref:Uncharacterized protein n=1 Tax=Allomyces macrogynus (strain ATCC 38327) TaxID=578462 RepID=A0A0L0T7U8_ALLM3|nr:hypothetical protein AMAG_14895 [Allomyces macrogynus ATCC 38327]|eukprot:KNE70771.1 hypothetical protein AMAG_14895 [Allomyces macrogynus ATCC 38327]
MAKFSTKKLVTVLAVLFAAAIATAHASPVVIEGGKDVTPDVVIEGGDKHAPAVVLERRAPVVIEGGKDATPDVVIEGGDKKNADPEYWNDGGRCSGKGRWSWYCY